MTTIANNNVRVSKVKVSKGNYKITLADFRGDNITTKYYECFNHEKGSWNINEYSTETKMYEVIDTNNTLKECMTEILRCYLRDNKGV